MTWFSWDPENGGIAFHATEAAAKAAAEASLSAERDGAADGGWSEAVEDICWGKVLGCVVEVERREPSEEYPEGFVDYALKNVEPTVYVVEQKPLTAVEQKIARQVVEETAEAIVADWNRLYPVGTKVRYWAGGIEFGTFAYTRTRSEARVLGGHTPVVWIDGYPACVALSHVEPDGAP